MVSFSAQFTEIMEVLEKSFFKEKTPFLGWLGPKCFIIIDHPDDIQVMQKKNYQVPTCLIDATKECKTTTLWKV